MEQFDSKYFRGQGPLFIAGRNAITGAPEGLIFVGDLASVEMTPQVDRWEVRENVSGKNAIGASGVRGLSYSLTIGMRSIKPDHLAIALGADNTAKTANSVTDELHTVYLGKMSLLEHNKVTNVLITGSGGTPTYVEDTDYVVHADEGLIEWLTGGSVTEALAVEIDYDYAAQHHLAVNPANADKYIVFAGINNADNDKQTRVELYKAQLDPSARSLITDEPTDAPLSGVVLLDTLRPEGDQLYSWKTED